VRTHEATISVPYPDPTVAATVERAIRLDAGDVEGDRSAAAVDRDGDTVVVTIGADDPSALRAAKRTWCSLVRAAEETALAARSE